MLLTTMPSGLDYLALISIVALPISFVASLIVIGIIAIIKKNQKTKKNYFFLWLKIFGIMFVSIIGLATIVFLFI